MNNILCSAFAVHGLGHLNKIILLSEESLQRWRLWRKMSSSNNNKPLYEIRILLSHLFSGSSTVLFISHSDYHFKSKNVGKKISFNGYFPVIIIPSRTNAGCMMVTRSNEKCCQILPAEKGPINLANCILIRDPIIEWQLAKNIIFAHSRRLIRCSDSISAIIHHVCLWAHQGFKWRMTDESRIELDMAWAKSNGRSFSTAITQFGVRWYHWGFMEGVDTMLAMHNAHKSTQLNCGAHGFAVNGRISICDGCQRNWHVRCLATEANQAQMTSNLFVYAVSRVNQRIENVCVWEWD